jgi:hypothetical protein
MKKTFFKLFSLFAVLIAAPTAVLAGPFCVGNFSGSTITWSLDAGNGGMAAYVVPEQNPGQDWSCLNLPAGKKLNLEVSNPNLKYIGKSCTGSVTEGQWVRVTAPAADAKETSVICNLFSEAGQISTLKQAVADADTGYYLQGTANFGKPIVGGHVEVLNIQGKVIASKQNATSAQGFFSVKMPGPMTEALGIQVEGGTVNGKRFTGRVMKFIPLGFDLETDFININPLTTIAFQYLKKNPDVSIEQSEQRVRQYLDLSPRLPFENLYGYSFDVNGFERQAAAYGGLNKFTQSLVAEMSADTTAVRSFHVPQMLKGFGFSDIMTSLAEAMASEIATGIFDQVRDGSKYETDSQKIFKLLALINTKLDMIDKKLTLIESQIKKADYNVRSSALWNDYKAIIGITTELELWNKAISQPNVSQATKDEAKIAAEKLRLEAIAKVMPFIEKVNAAFVTGRDIDSLQQTYAEYYLLKNPIADRTYLEVLDTQVQMYKSYQAAAMAILGAALQSSPATKDVAFKKMQGLIEKQVVMFPPNIKFFESADRVKEVRDGITFFDSLTFRIWDTHYTKFERCTAVLDYRKGMRAGNSNLASREEIRDMASHAARPNTWKDITKSLGFSDDNQKKMIVFDCEVNGAKPYNQAQEYDTIHWFGDDRTGPWDDYHDRYNDYRPVRDAKGMAPGLWFMTFRDYGNK